jgi:hypothetical protein
MTDGFNRSETEDTQKPRSKKDSSDFINREIEDSQGYFDVLLQAAYGIGKKLLSEYQYLKDKGARNN